MVSRIESASVRREEAFGIVVGACAVLLFLALFSFDATSPRANWVGPAGNRLATLLRDAFGWAAWFVVFDLARWTHRLWMRRPSPLGWATGASSISLMLLGSALVHLLAGQSSASASITGDGGLESPPALIDEESSAGTGVDGGMGSAQADVTMHATTLPGGLFGEVVAEVLCAFIGKAGAVVMVTGLLLLLWMLRSPETFAYAYATLRQFVVGTVTFARATTSGWLAHRWRTEPSLPTFDEVIPGGGTIRPRHQEKKLPRRAADEAIGGADVDAEDGYGGGQDHPGYDAQGFDAQGLDAQDGADEDNGLASAHPALMPGSRSKTRGARPSISLQASGGQASGGPTSGGPTSKTANQAHAKTSSEEADTHEGPSRHGVTQESSPRIVARKPKKVEPEALDIDASSQTVARKGDAFVLPPSTLLTPPPASDLLIDEDALRVNAERLVEKLAAYGVRGRVDEIHPGPVVTMYEFEPESGTKVSKIAGLADDLAMALAAQKVRIVAPIPGKARVGFELPNDVRETVYLREILEDVAWENTKNPLPLALGKDIAGRSAFGDLSKMPHVLVAGATGAGKSVGINVMLCSLLSKKTPEEVRMLMIDPKVVELAVFDGIPHMLLPVVTDMKKAARALRWAVDEMERRYQLFAAAGVRSIATFNDKVARVLAGDTALWELTANKRDDALRAVMSDEGADALEEAPMPEKLPYIVVVVDEFADLMMVAAKDVESAVARLAQKARAAGIHVILATQRPSVDVITGMIKANFPSRIAFKVSQREDSKTILGRSGAEHLLGMGDMLMLPPGASDLKRIHSAYVSEEEVRAVCDHLRAQGTPVYDENIVKPRDDEEDGEGASESDDPLYDKAVATVASAGYCSISHIQRQLGIGYNKAAKLVEKMEEQGVVGPASGKAGGRREVLVQQC